jgi:hypothetical protein
MSSLHPASAGDNDKPSIGTPAMLMFAVLSLLLNKSHTHVLPTACMPLLRRC